MSSNLSKEFFELIKAIGESKSKQEEDRIIQDEVRVLKQLVTDSKSTRRMKEVMVRLIYVEMLGHDASWGYVVAAQQTATPDLLQKRAGYLACSLMLSPDHEFRFMLVNQMQRDLASPNVLEACAALVACCKLVTLEMIPALLQRVADLLPHDQTLIRKKSVMALHRFYQLDPNSIAHLTDSIKSLLRDRDPAVMGAALCLLHDMARADPPSQADLVDQYVSILKQITEHRLPRDYDYHRMPAPWIQIKLLQILSTLGANDKKASECMYEVLGECMKRADTGTNIGYAVVYETVKTVTTIWPDPTLLDNAANAISRFLTSEAYNLKYLGVTGLAAIVRDHPKYALQHQMAVIDCLEDPDETLKRKTLELLFRMTNPGNAEAVVDKLLHFLEQAIDPFLRSDLVTRIVELADRYAPSNLWFVETMVKVIKVAGDLVDSDACQNLLRLFAEGVEQNDDDPDETENENAEMRRTGCSLLLEAVRKPHSSETLLKCAFWVLGEYGYLLSTQPQNGHSKSKRPQEEDDDVLRVEDDEESVEEEFEIVPLESVLTAICDAVERTTLVNHSTKAYGISAIAKISAQLGVVTPLARDTIRKHSSSRHTELQRRCREFQLVSKDMNRTRILFPVDASCEDFDNVDFSFLDEFTDILRAAGANEYQENLRVTNDYDFGETLASAPQQSQATKPTLKFDAYEAPKIFEPTPVATTTTTPSTSDISADDLMKMVANSSISTPPVPIPPPKPNVKSLWGPQGYMGTLPVIGGSIPQSSNNVQSYSPTPTTPTPATVTGVATISPDYDFGASAAEEQTSMEDLRPPPPPVKKELSEKEKAAQALFGGLGGSKSSGSKTKGASASSSTTRPAPVSQQQPQTKKPPAPPKQDLFSMDGDLLGVGDSVSTPVSTPTPAANNSLLDLFSSPSAPMTPPFVPVVSKALLNPSVMNTAQFGSLWPSHSAEARLSVPLTRPSFSEFIQSFAGKTQVHLVEYIPATMEAIFAGEASDRSIALIHAKLNGPTVDLMVRTQKPDLTGKVVDACRILS